MIPQDAPILTAAQMRAAEDAAFATGVSPETLMERAGLAVARETARLASGRPILVLAGPGNNGGDGYVAARVLRDWGCDVVVAALGVPATEGGRRSAARWQGTTIPITAARARPILVDALLGTGTIRPFDPVVATHIAELSRGSDLTIAVDLPSGIDADTGRAGTAILPADVTAALGALKPGHLTGPGAAASRHVLLADLAIPIPTMWRTIGRPRISIPVRDAHKYSRGMVVVVGGMMPGAAALAASAALHGGAGYVLLATPVELIGLPHAIVQRRIASCGDLERLLDDERIGTVVVGPGLGREENAGALLEVVLGTQHDLVVDGDALSLLGRDATERLRGHDHRVYLTPHAGEFARMFPDESPCKITRTVAAARSSGTVVIHKGPDTVIGRADGSATVAVGATSWLSTAGTGDVLAGLVAARHASGNTACAASQAVWLHARAARLAGSAFAADDLIPMISRAMAECAWN